MLTPASAVFLSGIPSMVANAMVDKNANIYDNVLWILLDRLQEATQHARPTKWHKDR
jgi:hypothetical protein